MWYGSVWLSGSPTRTLIIILDFFPDRRLLEKIDEKSNPFSLFFPTLQMCTTRRWWLSEHSWVGVCLLVVVGNHQQLIIIVIIIKMSLSLPPKRRLVQVGGHSRCRRRRPKHSPSSPSFPFCCSLLCIPPHCLYSSATTFSFSYSSPLLLLLLIAHFSSSSSSSSLASTLIGNSSSSSPLPPLLWTTNGSHQQQNGEILSSQQTTQLPNHHHQQQHYRRSLPLPSKCTTLFASLLNLFCPCLKCVIAKSQCVCEDQCTLFVLEDRSRTFLSVCFLFFMIPQTH